MAKEKEETSLAGRAWNATKEENDPDWASIPNTEFKGKREFDAERVKATGVAHTNFEIAVKEFAAEDAKGEEAPMAVVKETAPNAVPTEKSKAPAKVKAKAKAGTKAKAKAKAVTAKTDKSGHVPTAKEAAATKEAEKTAPLA